MRIIIDRVRSRDSLIKSLLKYLAMCTQYLASRNVYIAMCTSRGKTKHWSCPVAARLAIWLSVDSQNKSLEQ